MIHCFDLFMTLLHFTKFYRDNGTGMAVTNLQSYNQPLKGSTNNKKKIKELTNIAYANMFLTALAFGLLVIGCCVLTQFEPHSCTTMGKYVNAMAIQGRNRFQTRSTQGKNTYRGVKKGNN